MKRMMLLGMLCIFGLSVAGHGTEKENRKNSPLFVSTVGELSLAIRQKNVLDGLAISAQFYSSKSLAEKRTIQWLANQVLQRKRLVLVYGVNEYMDRETLKNFLGMNFSGTGLISVNCAWVNPSDGSRVTAGWPKSEPRPSEKRMKQFVLWLLDK